MFLLLIFIGMASTELSCKESIPSLEKQKEYVASIIQDYRTHNLNPFEIPDARWFSMAECGFHYTQKAINTIKENDIKKKQLSSLKNFWKFVKFTYKNQKINLKDLQIININFVYILSNQPTYIDHMKTIQSNLKNLKNDAISALNDLIVTYQSLDHLPLDGSNIPSILGNIGISNNPVDKGPAQTKRMKEAKQSGAFLGFNTNDCYVITFYSPEGSTGLFTEESFLKNFFGDICIYAHYLPNNDPIDQDQNPHAYDLAAASPYLMYLHDVLHAGNLLSSLLPMLQEEHIEIDLSNPRKIQKTSLFNILKEDLSKQNNKEFIYLIYQLIHEGFAQFFNPAEYDFNVKYNEVEAAINPPNNEVATLELTYFETLPLRTRFYSQLLRFIKKKQPVKSLYESMVEIISHTNLEENSSQGKHISANSLIHDTIFEYSNKKNMDDIESTQNTFTGISGNLIEKDQAICLNLSKPDNNELIGIFPISEKITIDSKMMFQVTFIPVDLSNVDEQYKELFSQINKTIQNFSNKFEGTHSAYGFMDDYISEGQALAHLNYEVPEAGHKGMHDIEYLRRIQNKWTKKITELLMSSEFNANLKPKNKKKMQDHIDLYKKAFKETKLNLQETILANMDNNKNNQGKKDQLFVNHRDEFKKYLTIINKPQHRTIWESLLDRPLINSCNRSIPDILLQLSENPQEKEELNKTASENNFLLIQEFIKKETTPFDALLQIFFSKDMTYSSLVTPSVEEVLDVLHKIATILENKDLSETKKKNQLKKYELIIRYFLSLQSLTDYIEYDYVINSDEIMTISKIKEREL